MSKSIAQVMDFKNEKDQTPRDIAVEYKKHDIVRLIQQIEKEEQAERKKVEQAEKERQKNAMMR